MTKIVTKTGDNGETSLCLGGRVSKTDKRIIATGWIDTVSAQIGLCKAILPQEQHPTMTKIQRNLMDIMGEISTSDDRKEEYAKTFGLLKEFHLDNLTKLCEAIQRFLPPQTDWTFYGDHGELSARLDYCSKLCRQAEIAVIEASQYHKVRKLLYTYLNRLNDYFYLCARKYSQL